MKTTKALLPIDAVAETSPGEEGTEAAITADEAADSAESPMALVDFARQVYDLPTVREETLMLLDADDPEREVPPSGDSHVALLAWVADPLLDPSATATSTAPIPETTIELMVGAKGTSAALRAPLDAEIPDSPMPLDATVVQV